MNAQNFLTADYLDIIFYNRNKHYGGYELRRHYAKRTMLSFLVITCAVAASLFMLTPKKSPTPAIDLRLIPHELSMVALSPIKVPPPPAQKLMSTSPTAVKSTVPKIVADHLVEESEMPEQNELKDVLPGTETKVGDGTNETNNPYPGGSASNAITAPAPTTTPVRWVEQMPEFDGNLNEYLAAQLRYPELARENNIQGRVTVEFVVAADGSITRARIVKGIGGGCDEEAIRVVRGMPRWKAGAMNGKPVSVYLTLPIQFQLN